MHTCGRTCAAGVHFCQGFFVLAFYKSCVFHCTFFHIWFSTFVSHFFDFVSFAFSNRSLLLQYIHVYPAYIAYVYCIMCPFRPIIDWLYPPHPLNFWCPKSIQFFNKETCGISISGSTVLPSHTIPSVAGGALSILYNIESTSPRTGDTAVKDGWKIMINGVLMEQSWERIGKSTVNSAFKGKIIFKWGAFKPCLR